MWKATYTVHCVYMLTKERRCQVIKASVKENWLTIGVWQVHVAWTRSSYVNLPSPWSRFPFKLKLHLDQKSKKTTMVDCSIVEWTLSLPLLGYNCVSMNRRAWIELFVKYGKWSNGLSPKPWVYRNWHKDTQVFLIIQKVRCRAIRKPVF